MKYIHELDAAYRVRVKHKNLVFCQYFNFHKYGDKELALDAAVSYRKRLLIKFGMIDSLFFGRSPDLNQSATNKPCIGIYKTHTVQRGKIFYNWTARSQIDYISTKKHYSIAKYGNKRAFLLACKHRFDTVGKIVILNKKLLPCRVPNAYR